MTVYIRTTPEPVNVLDEGYVRLVDVLGDDLAVVNAAEYLMIKSLQNLLRRILS